MPKSNARSMLETEAFMMDLFIAITQVMDLDPDVKAGWVKGLQNRKMANKAFADERDDSKFDDLVKGELDLLARLKAQIPASPKHAYEICWLDNITSDEKILQGI